MFGAKFLGLAFLTISSTVQGAPFKESSLQESRSQNDSPQLFESVPIDLEIQSASQFFPITRLDICPNEESVPDVQSPKPVKRTALDRLLDMYLSNETKAKSKKLNKRADKRLKKQFKEGANLREICFGHATLQNKLFMACPNDQYDRVLDAVKADIAVLMTKKESPSTPLNYRQKILALEIFRGQKYKKIPDSFMFCPSYAKAMREQDNLLLLGYWGHLNRADLYAARSGTSHAVAVIRSGGRRQLLEVASLDSARVDALALYPQKYPDMFALSPGCDPTGPYDLSGYDRFRKLDMLYKLISKNYTVPEPLIKAVSESVDITTPFMGRRTMVQEAVGFKMWREAALLVKYGADINQKIAGRDRAPLEDAISADDSISIKHLAALGADLTLKTSEGRTRLHQAAEENKVEALQALFDLNEDIQALDNYGLIPLHLAATKNAKEAVQWLLSHTPNPEQRESRYGLTPFEIATSQHHIETFELFYNRGARLSKENKSKLPQANWELIHIHYGQLIEELSVKTASQTSLHKNPS